jgi:hypothetical protein
MIFASFKCWHQNNDNYLPASEVASADSPYSGGSLVRQFALSEKPKQLG